MSNWILCNYASYWKQSDVFNWMDRSRIKWIYLDMERLDLCHDIGEAGQRTEVRMTKDGYWTMEKG